MVRVRVPPVGLLSNLHYQVPRARGGAFELKNKQTCQTNSHFIDESYLSFRIVPFSLKLADFHRSKQMPSAQGGDLPWVGRGSRWELQSSRPQEPRGRPAFGGCSAISSCVSLRRWFHLSDPQLPPVHNDDSKAYPRSCYEDDMVRPVAVGAT